MIRGFFTRLPHFIDEPTRADAEQRLATVAAAYRPEELQRFADHLELVLNPDGTFSDEDRARRRGIMLGPQGPDGMSRLSGWLDPALRAGLDAVLAKWAAPGMCNPADDTATVAGAPPAETINTDTRTTAQRNHDALGAGCTIWHRSAKRPNNATAEAPRMRSRIGEPQGPLFEDESDQHVDAVGNYPPVLKIHRLLLDPGRLDTTQRLLGPSEASRHGVFETGGGPGADLGDASDAVS